MGREKIVFPPFLFSRSISEIAYIFLNISDKEERKAKVNLMILKP